MPTNVTVPALGESVREAVLVRWHKADGEMVDADDPLCELETDKANVDVPSPAKGVLRRNKQEGETVQIGEAIATVDEKATAAAPTPAPKPAPAAAQSAAPAERTPVTPAAPRQEPGAVRQEPPAQRAEARPEDYSPAVRRLVEEHRLDARQIQATGPGGRLTKEDVERHLESRRGQENGEQVQPAAPAEQAPPASQATALPPRDQAGVRREPMTKIRRRIAERLVAAQQTAAILTTFNEVDLQNVQEIRGKFKEPFAEKHGVGLGLMSFFVRAIVLALKEFPKLNAMIDGNDVVYHDFVHMGIAVSTERGLAVPVLRNAESMSFAKVESEIKRLANATREGKLGLHELSGGTFTITNGGVFGSLLSTPILNPPQSGILGMHTIQKRPVVVNDKIEIRPMMYLALSYDHRLVDGRESVSFLVRAKQYLEDPARLMLEI